MYYIRLVASEVFGFLLKCSEKSLDLVNILFFLKDFSYLFGRESEHISRGEGQRDREK